MSDNIRSGSPPKSRYRYPDCLAHWMISQRTAAGTLSLPASPEPSNPPNRPRTMPAHTVTTSADTATPPTSPTKTATCPSAPSSRYIVRTYSRGGGAKPCRAPVRAINATNNARSDSSPRRTRTPLAAHRFVHDFNRLENPARISSSGGVRSNRYDPAGAIPAFDARNPRANNASLTSCAPSGGCTNINRCDRANPTNSSTTAATTTDRDTGDESITGPYGRYPIDNTPANRRRKINAPPTSTPPWKANKYRGAYPAIDRIAAHAESCVTSVPGVPNTTPFHAANNSASGADSHRTVTSAGRVGLF